MDQFPGRHVEVWFRILLEIKNRPGGIVGRVCSAFGDVPVVSQPAPVLGQAQYFLALEDVGGTSLARDSSIILSQTSGARSRTSLARWIVASTSPMASCAFA